MGGVIGPVDGMTETEQQTGRFNNSSDGHYYKNQHVQCVTCGGVGVNTVCLSCLVLFSI